MHAEVHKIKDGEKLTEIQEQNEKKKEYLNSYKNLCRKLKSLEEQLESIREVNQAAKIQQLSDMPRSGNQQDLSDYIVIIDNLEKEILAIRNKCIYKKCEIERCIANIPDGVESSILHKRYIEFRGWEQICVEVGYSWKQTHRLHSNALQNIKMT